MEMPPLLVHLHKLPPTLPDESMVGVLETLWKTRKSGLSCTQKSDVKSLLNLLDPTKLDPVLASLRLLIRKVSKEKLSRADIQKLLPADLSVEIQKTLLTVMQKYQNCLDDESAEDQPVPHQTRVKFPCRVKELPAYAPLQVSDLSSWPNEDERINYPYGVKIMCPSSSIVASNIRQSTSVPSLKDNGLSYNPATLPRLKFMTWTTEKKDSVPGNRVSVITLKLQDYTKSHLGEIEVKFQLSKDTLEAMLRSMTHINDQLSGFVSA